MNQGCERERLTPGTHATERQRQGRRSSPAKLDDGEVSVGSKGIYVFLKANSVTYFTRALLDFRVLAVGNGGAAVLHGVTPANLGIGDVVEVADEQERLKAKL